MLTPLSVSYHPVNRLPHFSGQFTIGTRGGTGFSQVRDIVNEVTGRTAQLIDNNDPHWPVYQCDDQYNRPLLKKLNTSFWTFNSQEFPIHYNLDDFHTIRKDQRLSRKANYENKSKYPESFEPFTSRFQIRVPEEWSNLKKEEFFTKILKQINEITTGEYARVIDTYSKKDEGYGTFNFYCPKKYDNALRTQLKKNKDVDYIYSPLNKKVAKQHAIFFNEEESVLVEKIKKAQKSLSKWVKWLFCCDAFNKN